MRTGFEKATQTPRAEDCRRHGRFLAVACGILTLGFTSTAQAQSIPTGYQEYFIVGNEQHIWDMMDSIADLPALPDGMNSVVSFAATTDNQVVYYDHWEDALETDILAPVQATTLVFGDGNVANGRACDYTNDPRVAPCDGSNDDILFQGTSINLNSDQGLVTAGCTAGILCTVPVNPRGIAIHFDGGDRLFTSGGPISLIHTQDPQTPFIGGSVEMFSRQAVAEAYSYSIPAGVDSYGGDDSATEPFQYVYIDLVAFDDGTNVTIDNGLATVSFTLDRGQQYSSLGSIDPGGPAVAGIQILAGTKISTSGPIVATLFTATNVFPQADFMYANRMYALQPDRLHSTDYVIAAPGDNPTIPGGFGGVPDRPLNLYIFNPDPFNAITVTATDCAGQVTINVPANSMNDFRTVAGRNPGWNAATTTTCTVRLTSDRNFWGISAYNHTSGATDWGDSYLATRFLSTSCTVPYAPDGYDALTGNSNPVFVSPVIDGTLVQIDLNNDGIFDQVDTDGDGTPEAFTGPPGTNSYVVNTLQSLRIFDYTDDDNAGTTLYASAPIAVSYGQDTDVAPAAGGSDTGYTAMPNDQRFLDTVLTIDKAADPIFVPTSGGTVTYTLTVRSYDFGPLTNLTVSDLMPAGVPGSAYVLGSTLVTYPDLSQSVADPAITLETSGRWRLTWTLSPDTIGVDQTLIISYQITIPAGPAGRLQNNARAQAQLGGSLFTPTAWTYVDRTDVSITKSVVDDGSPEPGDVLTYSVVVENNGVDETNVVVTDPIPAGTSFVPGSITNAGPFTGTYSAAQNAVVWTGSPFLGGTGPFTLTFQVSINPTTATGFVITNRAYYRSNETPTLVSDPVETIVVGPELTSTKTATPSSLLHPLEVVRFEILVQNTGAGAADNLVIQDLFPGNATYVTGSMSWSLNGSSFTALTDAADADQGTLYADRVELLLASLGAGQDVRFRFQARVDAGTAGQFVTNQGTIYADQVDARDTNLIQIPIVGDAVINGHVFLDLDGDGALDAGEPGIANVTVYVTDADGVLQTAVTDANGDYVVTVVPGAATLDVDENDPDIPAGSTLTTANDPQTQTAVSGGTVSATPVGYQPPPLSIDKVSSAAGSNVAPGETITYTITITNNTAVTQTGIEVTDPLPTGTTYVAGSSQVSVAIDSMRVTEYFIASGSFSGTQYDLTLNQDLASDYFVIVQGSDGAAGGGGPQDRGPDEDYAALTQDPFGTGDLGVSAGSDVLRLERGNAVNSWVGVVTVVECLANCDTSGFTLLDVQRVAHSGALESGTDTSGTSWSDINQVLLMGGANGAGCNTAETTDRDHPVCHVRLWPSGANTINWTRDGSNGSVNLTAATSTVMVVEWGGEWTVQRVNATGSNGGDGVDAAGEYNNAALGTAVARDNTWIWGTGHANGSSVGTQAEGVVVTLGNGVAQNATESQVSVATEFGGTSVDFDVYVMTHPNLAVDYRFKADGNSGDLTVDVPVDAAGVDRMALSYNGQDSSTGDDYPRPILSSRYLNSSAVRLERRRAGFEFPAWVQGVDFSAVQLSITAPGNPPPNLVIPADGYTLDPGQTMTVTFQVLIDDPLDPAVTQIVNTATVETDQQGPLSDTTNDPVVRPSVVVEPNNADFTTAGTTVTYVHNVVNASTTSGFSDSYRLTLTSESGWTVELLDPDTGAVIATDSNGDGVWDGGVTINTGTLAPGESLEYHVRVTVPVGTPVGTQDTARLTATSNRVASVSASGEDETTVLGSTDFGPVAILPDNSGVVAEGESVVYVHRVINRTGAADTFDLQAESSQGWIATIYYDSNGDGVYTPGVDVAITNTSQLANNASQLIFVVVDCPAGTASGTVDVTHLTATSRNDDTLFDGATDTTTVIVIGLDLSGGGSRLVQGGDTGVFPGTLMNLGDVAETYNFDVSESSLNGLDPYNHPTQLVIDTDSDGVPDLVIAEDADGDGTWDTIASGYDTDGNSEPDVTVPAFGILAYELRRAVDVNQVIHREHVTLTAADSSGRNDSVTATNLLAAITRATIRGVKMRPGVIEFATGPQSRTRAFNIYERGKQGALRLLTPRSVPTPAPTSLAPLLYRVEVPDWSGGEVMIEEIELGGRRRVMGPFSPRDRRLEQAFERISALFDRASVPGRDVRVAADGPALKRFARLGRRGAYAKLAPRHRLASEGVKIEIAQPGWIEVSLSDLEQAGLPVTPPAPLHLTNLGRRVRFTYTQDAAGEKSIRFLAAPLMTEYSSRNVYVVTAGLPAPRPAAGLSFVTPPPASGWTRIERNAAYVAPAPEETDPWVWSMLFTDFGDWPYWDPEEGRFDLPGLPTELAGDIPVEVHIYGYSPHAHEIEARINGHSIGQASLEGATSAVISGTIPAGALLSSGNDLGLSYSATPLPGAAPDAWAIACLDRVDIGVSLSPQAGAIAELSAYSTRLPRLRGVEYLVVTHRLFAEQAARLAAAKEAEGLKTAIVDVEQAYDAFAAGFVDPNAVRTLIRYTARRSHRLKYVALLGDDTVDPHDNMQMGNTVFIPSPHVWHKDSGRVPSETPFSDVDADGRPDISIGRLPLQTPEEAEALIDKILDQTATLENVLGRHLFAVDNAGEDDLPFRSEADMIASRLPTGSLVAWSDIASGTDAARAMLDAAWNDGALMVHFFGHGGPDVWTDQQLLSVETIEERLAEAPPAVVLTWTCQTQWYVYPWSPTVNEQLLLQPTAGAVALFGPAGATPPAGQKLLYDRLYDVLFSENDFTLGKIILQAKRRALEETPGSRSAVDTFCLLGDPALRLP